jgi:FtsP/CotA-like multicopper oxidase with cupredoxin domain
MKTPMAGILASLVFLLPASAAPVELIVKPEKIAVGGREVEVYSIVQPDGTRGVTVDQKDGFHVIVKNELPFPTAIHWHGLILPNSQDGVPFVTQDPIPPGGRQEYRFPLVQHGTYWMHSHYGLQEQVLTSAPLIILNDEERAKANREVTVMLADFSFKTPRDILAGLVKPDAPAPDSGGMKGMGEEKNSGGMEDMGGMGKKRQPTRVQVWDAAAGRFTSALQEKPPTDIDVRYDALLANRRPADQAEVVAVKGGESVLLRLIAGASVTNFFIDTGGLEAEILAVDGKPVEPLRGNFFQLGLAQRIDLRVTIPAAGGAFPILALGEGTKLQTGVILATAGAEIPRLAPEAAQIAGALDNTQEIRLRATEPLAPAKVDRELPSALGGNMAAYVWTINGRAYPNRDSLDVKKGERVAITLTNSTMMSHPMHLHGHDFQVVEIDGQTIPGPLRDTVIVPPGSTIKVIFDADNPGVWAYHCHIVYHLIKGMFTVVKYEGADTAFWQPEKTLGELKEKLP